MLHSTDVPKDGFRTGQLLEIIRILGHYTGDFVAAMHSPFLHIYQFIIQKEQRGGKMTKRESSEEEEKGEENCKEYSSQQKRTMVNTDDHLWQVT